MARFCRAILNHAPLRSYRKRFSPEEPTDYPLCGVLQDRAHIVLTCPRYRGTAREIRIPAEGKLSAYHDITI